MNIIAEMALRRAKGRVNSVRSRKSSKAPMQQAACTAQPQTEVLVSGPINRVMFLEGRNWAIDIIRSLREAPTGVAIERLTGATADRPGSYAAGIKSVIAELAGASTAEQDESSLGDQAGREE